VVADQVGLPSDNDEGTRVAHTPAERSSGDRSNCPSYLRPSISGPRSRSHADFDSPGNLTENEARMDARLYAA
jgi:hypothetical protein